MQGGSSYESSYDKRRSCRGSTGTVSDYAHQAYMILLVAFVVAPIVAGLDKYFNILTDWTRYLSPIVPSWTGIAARHLR